MQTVILAAGRGTRLGDLTKEIPKPLIKINGKNLIEYKISQLPEEIDELILVIGYLGEQVREYFGDDYHGLKIKYVWQNELLGTGHSIHLCRKIISGRFMVMMGDDVYVRADIEKCLKHDQSMLVLKKDGDFSGGQVIVDEEGNLVDIVEGKYHGKNLVNTGLYVIRKEFFNYDLVKLPGKEEWGLPQTLAIMAKDDPVAIEKASFWVQVNSLEDLETARRQLS